MGIDKGDAGWDALGLDPRLLRALTKKRYRAPTPVQSRAIPLVLEGKDVVARAHTGSGKTAAYLLPAIHKIMQSGEAGGDALNPRALVLVPTRELAHQVKKEAALSSPSAPRPSAPASLAAGCAAASSANSPAHPGGPRRHPRPRRRVRPRRPLPPGRPLVRPPAPGPRRGGSPPLLRIRRRHPMRRRGGPARVPVHAQQRHVIRGTHATRGARAAPPRAPRRGRGGGRGGGRHRGGRCRAAAGPKIAHHTVEVATRDKLLYCMALLRLGLCKRKSLVLSKTRTRPFACVCFWINSSAMLRATLSWPTPARTSSRSSTAASTIT